MTPLLLNVLKDQHGINTIGFYLAKELERGIWTDILIETSTKRGGRHQQQLEIKKQFNREKCAIVNKKVTTNTL